MKLNLNWAFVLMILLVFGCEKDNNPLKIEDLPEQNVNNNLNNSGNISNIQSETVYELTLENFFNPIYVRQYFDMPSNRIVVSDDIINLMEELFTSNYSQIAINQIGNFYGMPCWSCSEHDPNTNNFSMTPIYDLQNEKLTALIIAKHDESPINIELIDRNVFDISFDPQNPRHLYINDVFDFFDEKLHYRATTALSVDTRSGICEVSGSSGWCRCSIVPDLCGNGGAPPCNSGCGQVYEPGGHQGNDWEVLIPFRDQIQDADGTYFTGVPNLTPPSISWSDIGAMWGINLDAFNDVLNPNDTSFPPVQGDGNWNTEITNDIPTFNLQQAIQLLQIQIISFINHYNLNYTPEQMEQIVTLQACGVLNASDFFLCASYQLINHISTTYSQLNLIDDEKIYIWNHFELFPDIEDLIAQHGTDYTSNLLKIFISLDSIPNYNPNWDDFVALYDLVVNNLKPLLDLNENEVDLLVREETGSFATELANAFNDNPDVDDLIPDCDGCSAGEAQIIRSAHNNGVEDLECIIQQLSQYDGSTPSVVKDALEQNFGGVSNTFFASAVSIMLKFSKFHVSGADYQIDTDCSSSSTIAWVYPAGNLFDVRICKPKFFNVSSLTQEYTLVHEWTHLYMLNADHAYSWEGTYANLGFFLASMNADSYEEFIKAVCQ